MKNMVKIKVSPFNLCLFLLGVAILVAGILLFALNPGMSWKADVIIGFLMAVCLGAMFNIPMQVYSYREEPLPAHHHHRQA